MEDKICDSVKTPIICDRTVVRPKKLVVPSSFTGGVKAMSIQGRLYRERERLAGCGMTDEEREWRKQWIRDQRLGENEPVHVPEIKKELYNPIRRLYRFPMDVFERVLSKSRLGAGGAAMIRFIVAKSAFGLLGVYAACYYFKYNANDWTRKGGWRVVWNRPTVTPADPGWPYQPERLVPADYADFGFKNSPIQKPLDVPETEMLVKRVRTNVFADLEFRPRDLRKIVEKEGEDKGEEEQQQQLPDNEQNLLEQPDQQQQQEN